jgi:hypothetical protein
MGAGDEFDSLADDLNAPVEHFDLTEITPSVTRSARRRACAI